MLRFTKPLFSQTLASRFILGEEVAEAFANQKPVVALESTVITHGLSFPHNLETAKLLESTIRKENVTPATIGLINGKVKVGLSNQELEMIADPEVDAVKVSVRDISNVLVKKVIGGTTVAATMRLAYAAGIRVFATGGIGGVHRGAESTFDISADLIELGQTPVAVVCAGAKSILDIPKTLEYLETHSCNVIVYGNDRHFPGFFTPKTEHLAPMNSSNIDEIAEILALTDVLSLQQGTLIACPLPEEYSAAGKEIESVIQTAVKECRDQKISSKDVTPFILKRVNEMTKGKSMATNIALLQNNAKIAAQIAKSYSQKVVYVSREEEKEAAAAASEAKKQESKKAYTVSQKPEPVATIIEDEIKKPKVLCIGAAIIDFEVITNENVKNDGGSYKGSIFQRCGGVARNHAEALGRLGCDSTLLTSVGSDDLADYLRTKSTVFDISHANIARGFSSATYMSVNINGNIVHGFSSIEDSAASITPEYIAKNEKLIAETDYILIDGNLPERTIKRIMDIAESHRKKVWFEPTDIAKATKILHSDSHLKIHSISPNANEAAKLCEALGYQSTPFAQFESNLSNFNNEETVSTFLEKAGEFRMGYDLFAKNPKLTNVFITLGPLGILGIHHDQHSDKVICFPIPPPSAGTRTVVSVSGAGDCFNSGFLASQLYGLSYEQSVRVGRECAKESLLTVLAVPESLNSIGEKLIEHSQEEEHVHTENCCH